MLWYREDMIQLLGKRPFPHKEDEMDKWLDEQRDKKEALKNLKGAGVPESEISPPATGQEAPVPTAI